MITGEVLHKVFPRLRNPDEWAKDLFTQLPKYGIITLPDTAMFLAQTGHESLGFTVLKENLNYSAQGLLTYFHKYFRTSGEASMYARQPERIANRVYANRMGNGSEKSGDGWRFKGRGIIQCTGKDNYTECSYFLFGDERLLDHPEMLEQPEFAIASACWYWVARDLSSVSDIVEATHIINGGENGLEDRIRLYGLFTDLLA